MKLEAGNWKIAILIAGLAGNVLGFEATMTIQPPLIELNEAATLSIQVRNAKNPKEPVLPNVPGLRFVSAGQSTQMSWANGKTDNYTSFNYQIYPQQTGDFSIGPFEYKMDGQTQTLQGALKVVSGGNGAPQAQNWSDLLFAKLTADRQDLYVQEPFALTLSIYSRQGIQMGGNIGLQGMPETGLSDLKWQELQPSREAVNGSVYEVRRFRTVTRPLSSGSFNLAPVATVQVAVPNQNNRNRDPFFSAFFDRVETRPVELPAEQTVIHVKPLPDIGKPDGFSGAVGRFNFSVSAKPLEVHPGDPVTLTLRISGDGNFSRVMMPPVPDGDRFRLFGDAVRTQEEDAVQFEQVISPRTAAVKEIPAIPFSFFDTESGQYRTVQSTPIPLTVTATSNSTAQVFAVKDSVIVPPPETPFATESDVQRIESAVQTVWNTIRPWLWTIPAAMLLWLAVFIGRKLHIRRSKDTARVRRQKAPKAARKALHAATGARNRGDNRAFYDALWNALADYFGHRLNLPPGDVTSSTVQNALIRAGLDPETTDRIRALFEQLDAQRYGLPSAAGPDELKTLQTDLEKALKSCEKVRL